ncbi:MAG: hypothetical protein ACRCSQ_00230 [Bacteroidales bacterium]
MENKGKILKGILYWVYFLLSISFFIIINFQFHFLPEAFIKNISFTIIGILVFFILLMVNDTFLLDKYLYTKSYSDFKIKAVLSIKIKPWIYILIFTLLYLLVTINYNIIDTDIMKISYVVCLFYNALFLVLLTSGFFVQNDS